MNNVDHIIKYLSGDLNPEESRVFEQELHSNPELKEEYEEVSAAYTLIRKELQERDLDHFKQRLSEVMVETREAPVGRKLWHWRILPYLLAGSLAILLIIFLSRPDESRIFSKYYHPAEDRVLLAINQGTRGEMDSGIFYFQQGEYAKCMEVMSGMIDPDQENLLAQLYYLLASIEAGMQESALEKLDPSDLKIDHQLAQAIYWYRALALIKTGRNQEAEEYLQALSERQGPYQSVARSLQRNL